MKFKPSEEVKIVLQDGNLRQLVAETSIFSRTEQKDNNFVDVIVEKSDLRIGEEIFSFPQGVYRLSYSEYSGRFLAAASTRSNDVSAVEDLFRSTRLVKAEEEIPSDLKYVLRKTGGDRDARHLIYDSFRLIENSIKLVASSSAFDTHSSEPLKLFISRAKSALDVIKKVVEFLDSYIQKQEEELNNRNFDSVHHLEKLVDLSVQKETILAVAAAFRLNALEYGNTEEHKALDEFITARS